MSALDKKNKIFWNFVKKYENWFALSSCSVSVHRPESENSSWQWQVSRLHVLRGNVGIYKYTHKRWNIQIYSQTLEYTNIHRNVGIYKYTQKRWNIHTTTGWSEYATLAPQPSTAALRGSPAGLGIELSKPKSDAQLLSSAPDRCSVDESWSQVTETESAAVTDQVVVWPPERLSTTSLQLPGWRYTGGMGEKSFLHCPAFLTRVTWPW